MKKIIFIISFLVMFGLAFNFSAPTAQAATTAEIQTLIQIIQQLQQQVAQLQRRLEQILLLRQLVVPSITVISPNGGERWVIGNRYNITWRGFGDVGMIDIILVDHRAGPRETVIATNVAAPGGIYSWTIPRDIIPGDTAFKISIRGRAIHDDSDRHFSIVGMPAEAIQQQIAQIQQQVAQLQRRLEQILLLRPLVAPSITVISPNGGERWMRGNAYDIVWESKGVEKVIIMLVKGARVWDYLARDFSAEKGKFTWKIPEGMSLGDDYKIMINDSKKPKPHDKSNNYFSIVKPVVVGPALWDWDFCAPRRPCAIGQGDCDRDADCAAGLFCAQNVGAKYGQVSGMDVCEKKVEVVPSITHISPDSGTSNDMITIYGKNLVDTIPSGVIIEFLKKDGLRAGTIGSQHVFTKPDGLYLRFQLIGILAENLGPGTYQIRVINDRGKSNAMNFTIVAPSVPSITVTSPNGGERWEIEQTRTIEWRAKGLEKVDINLHYRVPGYALYHTVAIATRINAAQGTYQWRLSRDFFNRFNIKPGDKFKIMIADAASDPVGVRTIDKSNNYFSIVEREVVSPFITVISPNGGERWTIGSRQDITWQSFGVDAISIVLVDYRAGPRDVLIIASDIPIPAARAATRGGFSWTLPDLTLYPNILCDSCYKISIRGRAIRDDSNRHFSIVEREVVSP